MGRTILQLRCKHARRTARQRQRPITRVRRDKEKNQSRVDIQPTVLTTQRSRLGKKSEISQTTTEQTPPTTKATDDKGSRKGRKLLAHEHQHIQEHTDPHSSSNEFPSTTRTRRHRTEHRSLHIPRQISAGS